MDRILRLSANGLAALGQPSTQPTDGPVPDSAEQHGRAGVPMEVMGLMLGEFVDDYTVTVVDVFAMPQSGTGISVEAVDPVFQAKMLDMLKQTGRPEMVVGWYHSHPGFGCWLSGVDMNTQQSFEALSDRAVAVVVDPIQSVKGKVVIDAFRLINPNLLITNQEPRQTTSNVGHLNKPSIQALIHGLNRQYYSLPINYRKNQWETKMLMDLNKNTWKDGLSLADYDTHCTTNHKTLTGMLDLIKAYYKSLEEEEKMTPEQLVVKNVGRMDPKRHLGENVEGLMTSNIAQCVGTMLHSDITRPPLVSRVNEYNLNVNSGFHTKTAMCPKDSDIRVPSSTRTSVLTSVVGARGSTVPLKGPPGRTSGVQQTTKSRPGGHSVSFPAPCHSYAPSIHVTCTLSSRTTFEVIAPYHAGLSELYKCLPTRQYNSSTRKWSFGLRDYKEFVRQAKAIPGVVLDGLPSAVLKTFKSAFSDDFLQPDTKRPSESILADCLPEDLIRALLPFQREGVSLGLARSGRILLADDMGLGKTVQSLALAAVYRADWPLLIVAPSSVRFAWREQCLHWLSGPLRLVSSDILVVTSGRDLDGINQHTNRAVMVISYDLMTRHVEQLRLCYFGMVIMDESHFLKNSKAARTKAALPLLKAAKRVLLLSGTPAVSRPAELYPQICGIAPNLFSGGFHEFGLRYCAAKECPWGWDYTGCSNMSELQLILEESIMIRRIKADVLNQLPPKRRELVVLDPNVIKAGRLKRHAKAMTTTDLSGDAKRAAMLQYFHETASVKLPALQQYVLDLIEVGRKFLLFAHHTEVMDALSNLLAEKSVDFIRIDGRTNSEQRSVVCEKFQQEENCLVALLSITAAGTGISLTAANLVVFAELFWNPGALVQAEDRAYRIGQRDSVLVRYLLAEGTADDYIWSLIEKKLDVLSKAGLNRETFRTADTMRLGSSSSIQQSILDYVESEFMSETVPDDTVVAVSSPVFEPDTVTELTVPPAKRSKVTNLFSSSSTLLTTSPNFSQCSGRILVSNTPETSPDKEHPQTLSVEHSSSLAPALCRPEMLVETEDETVVLEDDDTLLLEAAEAAEVAWLTEGLLNETETDQFS
ncbi:hypothetical protein P879_00945 [Paragonimus westermani]|uniref:26S proteasome regulatory subunit RPN11 n=1 Tax=Paragonimus westermani TaxID=34504 RepID=A0A8T0DY02_9TREM|nr:hypothetical protein P879_00945 [Paragonimus westermani]